jgi:hypothetical protein
MSAGEVAQVWSVDDIENAVIGAVGRMMAEDRHLMLYDCSEMAIIHRVAVYLEGAFPGHGHSVDCEYNRNLHATKRVQLPGQPHPTTRTRPDLVIHKRGLYGHYNSLFAMEAKKVDNPDDVEDDYDKLRALRDGVHAYDVVAFLLLKSRPEDTKDPIGATLAFGRDRPVLAFPDTAPALSRGDWWRHDRNGN